MADWGRAYGRHDVSMARWSYPRRSMPVALEVALMRLRPRACDCWKRAAPLCAGCQHHARERDALVEKCRA